MEKKGFKLAALKLFQPDKALAEEHYKDLSSKPFFKDLVDYIISGPVVAMVRAGSFAAHAQGIGSLCPSARSAVPMLAGQTSSFASFALLCCLHRVKSINAVRSSTRCSQDAFNHCQARVQSNLHDFWIKQSHAAAGLGGCWGGEVSKEADRRNQPLGG